MDARRHAYFLCVAEALAQCQLLELQLKFHISSAFELRAKKPYAPVPFKMTPAMAKKAKKEHAKAPLGSLIKYFERLSDSPALVASLKKFTKKRNRLAHALLAAALDYEGELDYGKADSLTGEVEMTKETALRLNDEVHAASLPWIVHLYLDVIEDDKPAN